MFVEFMDIVRLVLAIGTLFVASVLIMFRRKHNLAYANENATKTRRLTWRLSLTYLLKIISVFIPFALLFNLMDLFSTVYILFPALIALHIIIYRHCDGLKGFMTFIKGIYYWGLAIMTILQYWHGSNNAEILILGFTLAIAVFESITAISDGCEKMKRNSL